MVSMKNRVLLGLMLGLGIGLGTMALIPKPKTQVCLTYEDLQGIQKVMNDADVEGIKSDSKDANLKCSVINWWITTYRLKVQ